jgi:nitrogenase molybdenum-iron protein beta chain
MGYQGGLRVLTAILDKFFDVLDQETDTPSKTDYSFDLTR